MQGIAEFLPVSSSAHLILVPPLFGWADQGLAMDIAVHVGTLLAVMIYLRRDIVRLSIGAAKLVTGKFSRDGLLLPQLIAATIPAVVAGYFLESAVGTSLRSVEVVAWSTLFWGLILYAVDRFALTVRRIEHLTFGHAIAIGIAQAIALIPGTSRSGITMTAARALGFERTEAARLSLLMSMPVIFAAGALGIFRLDEQGHAGLDRDAVIACGLAFVTALVAIAGLMYWLRRASFTPFVIYRVITGIALLAWIYGA